MRTKITSSNDFILGLPATDAIHLLAKPIRCATRSPAPATLCCNSTNDVQKFKIKPRYGEVLNGGWYVFELDLQTQQEPLLWAAFYADYKKVIHEACYLPLPLSEIAPGKYQVIARFTHRLIGLRLDLVAHGGVRIDQARLRKLSKFEAASRMLLAVMQSAPTHKKKLVAALVAIQKLVFSGQRGFATWLYREYSEDSHAPLNGRYLTWIGLYGNSIPADIENRLGKMSRKPLISVAICTCDTDEASLRRCIGSVLAQHYPHWELSIVDNASDIPHVRALLSEFSGQDPRISCTFMERRGDDADALNRAIRQTHGDYVTVVKAHDELHPLAFFQVANEVGKHPDWKIVYTDEDKIDHRRIRFDPDFKPDWNYELLLAQNYIRHLCIFEHALVEAVGGFRPGFHGCEDYDFLLRCIECTSPAQIGHIAAALYHEHATADAPASPENHTLHANGTRALEQHLKRAGIRATVATAADGIHRIRFQCPQPAPFVSLVVPTRDKVRLLRSCLDSILKSSYSNYEIIVVDNRSTDGNTLRYLDKIARMPRVRVLHYDAPFNYSAINNFAERHAAGDILGLVNNDIEIITPDWMEEMVSHAVRPNVGAVGAMLYYPDGTIQHAGVIVGLGGVAGHAYLHMPRGYGGNHNRGLSLQNLSAVTAACMLVCREAFNAVGGLDESLEVAFNDVDFCLRLRDAGYRNVWTPYAQMYHMESASRGDDVSPEQQDRFQREIQFMRSRWGAGLLKDPAYNANLSLSSHCFDLAFPPRG